MLSCSARALNSYMRDSLEACSVMQVQPRGHFKLAFICHYGYEYRCRGYASSDTRSGLSGNDNIFT